MIINKIDNFNVNPVNTANNVDTPVKTKEKVELQDKKYNPDAYKQKQEISIKELDSAVDKANKVLFKNNTHLQFRIHQKTNEVMVKIVEDETGEVLREIPPEKMLDMVAKLWEIAGILVDEKR